MKKLINIAVIAHVDAGKSTLVDALLRQSGVFREGQELVDLVMDSNDLERERGITIYSKNCSIMYDDVKINIVDTPGHADFSSEVERIIKTVDTVILLVDGSEGPMPQTRFVLEKSLEIGLNPILFINKIDKKDERAEEVVDMVYQLFLDLNASDKQLDFPILYGVAKEGIAKYSLDDKSDNIIPLIKTIVNHVPLYEGNEKDPLLIQISSLAYDDYVGRLGIGRIYKGQIKKGQKVRIVDKKGHDHQSEVKHIYVYEGLKRVEVNSADAGDIIMLSGFSEISIGETISDLNTDFVFERIPIEEPTLSMIFSVNTSPFAGQSGKYITSRNIRERLFKELEVNVGLRVETTSSTDSFKVSGRGELHLTILIENMRREGFELSVGNPQVIYKTINGTKYEPMEKVIISAPLEYSGTIINKLSLRKAEMLDMYEKTNYSYQTWLAPTRGLIGYRNEFINDTHGEGTIFRQFDSYQPYLGDINKRSHGVMISNANGVAMTYSIFNLQERGQFFIGAQTPVYEGMIVAISARDIDMDVNPTKNKKATAIRSAGNDEAMRLVPPKEITLEYAVEFIQDDELIEVTPAAIRLRKKHLKEIDRKKHNKITNI